MKQKNKEITALNILGGMVLISGTGSYCVLVNPLEKKFKSIDDIEIFSSGGWGSILGDEGSAFWISIQLIKYVININDNITRPNDLIEYNELKELIFDYFQVNKFQSFFK